MPTEFRKICGPTGRRGLKNTNFGVDDNRGPLLSRSVDEIIQCRSCRMGIELFGTRFNVRVVRNRGAGRLDSLSIYPAEPIQHMASHIERARVVAMSRVEVVECVVVGLVLVVGGAWPARTAVAQTDAGPADAADARDGGAVDVAEDTGEKLDASDDASEVWVVDGIDPDRECARVARYAHSVSADGGREGLRTLTRNLCADGGVPDVSVDEAVDTLVDDVPMIEDEESWWEMILVGTFEVGLPLLIGFLAWWGYRRRQQRFDAIMAEGEPAFDVELDIRKLRADPEPLEEIKDDVDEVCIVRLPSGQGGGYGGSTLTVDYAAFVVDEEGKTHEFSRGDDWGEVEADAEWVAERLGVEVRDASYGGG